MRCLNRNKVTMYFARYTGKEPVLDDDGCATGEYRLTYENPQKLRAAISAASGQAEAMFFGSKVSYDKVITGDSAFPDIDEYSVFWIDTLPVIAEDGTTTTPYDYKVSRVAKNLNSVLVAVSKVDVQ